MASITLTGTLLDPTGEVAVGDQIRFTHRTTTGETIQFARSVLIIPPNGLYNITLEFGLIFVEYLDIKDVNYKSLGVVTVNQDSTATDLPGLLNAIVPPTDAQLLLFQGILQDTEDARDIALLAAAQQTTLELIASTTTHPNSTVLTLSGHTLPGDGGGGKWQLNGVVGQTPSQSPTQLADFLLNDGNGNQWALVDGVVLAFNGVQYLPLPFGATGNGNYAYNNNDFDKIVDPDRLNPATLAAWQADTSAQDEDVVHVIERTSGFGGGDDWTVVTGETPNGANIIGHNTLSLQLSLIIGSQVKAASWTTFDGVTDDADNLQEMLEFCFNNEVGFVGAAVNSRLSKTLFIPNFPSHNKFVSLDFNGINFIPDEAVNDVIVSGKLDAGVWVTAMNDAPQANQTNSAEIKNFTVVRDLGLDNSAKTAVQLKDWHYSCEIKQIGVRRFGVGFLFRNCFSAEIDMCKLWNSESSPRAGIGIILETASNLITLKRCTALNTAIGYEFRGGLTAVAMNGCSFEGQTKGLVCTGQVFDLGIFNSYIEGIDDVVFEFQSRVETCVFENNYVNLTGDPGTFLFDYLPAPSNNLLWKSSNVLVSVADSQIFKTVDPTVGFNSVTWQVKPVQLSSIDQLDVDPANFPLNTDYQAMATSTSRAKIVNVFAEAQYAGRFSTGIDDATGFEFVDTGTSAMELRTRYTASATARIYVSLRISASGLEFLRGELVGDSQTTGNMDFYEYTATGLDKSTKLTVTIVSGFFHLHFTAGNVVTAVLGEVRLC